MEGTSGLTHAGIPDHLYRRRWWTLVVLCTSLMIVIVGNTALNVALPTLARELNAIDHAAPVDGRRLRLVFAGLLFTAGALGDRFGRKGALQVGLLVFSSGSLLAAFADSADGGHRRPGGHGPGRRVRHALHAVDPHQRLPAVGAHQGHRHLGRHLRRRRRPRSCRQRLPARALLVGLGVPRQRADHRRRAGRRRGSWCRRRSDPESAKLDPFGALLSIAGLGSLVYAIIEAPRTVGLSAATPRSGSAAPRCADRVFVWWELRNRAPDARPALVPRPALQRGLRRDRRSSSSRCSALFFLLTQYFQLVSGYSTLQAGRRAAAVRRRDRARRAADAAAVGPHRREQVVALGLAMRGRRRCCC